MSRPDLPDDDPSIMTACYFWVMLLKAVEDLSSLWSEEDDKEQCERGDDIISLCAGFFF